MPTYASVAADLLKQAAIFYKNMGEERENIRKQMLESAAIYTGVAELLSRDPAGATVQGDSYAALASKLLRDTATFYRKLAVQNEPLREQLEYNANIYDEFAGAVAHEPLGHID